MKNSMSLFHVLSILLALSLLLSACAQTPTTEQPQVEEPTAAAIPDVIKIGVNETMTGWGAAYGDMTW